MTSSHPARSFYAVHLTQVMIDALLLISRIQIPPVHSRVSFNIDVTFSTKSFGDDEV